MRKHENVIAGSLRWGNTTGRHACSRPHGPLSPSTYHSSSSCGDANQLAEDKTHGYHPKPTNNLPLKICNKEVVFVDSFTYLGSLITNDGSSSRDITSRIAKAASAMCRLSNPLFRKHRISIRTKTNMYRALVVSVLLYGSEAWATTLADRRRLRQRRLRWFGHLHRMHCHPPSLYEESLTSTLTSMVGRDQEAAPKPDGRIQSNMISILLASTPSMPHRWSKLMTDPSGRPLFADC